MNFEQIVLQVYNTGLLAFAIMALAIAIIVYPTLRNHSEKKRK